MRSGGYRSHTLLLESTSLWNLEWFNNWWDSSGGLYGFSGTLDGKYDGLFSGSFLFLVIVIISTRSYEGILFSPSLTINPIPKSPHSPSPILASFPPTGQIYLPLSSPGNLFLEKKSRQIVQSQLLGWDKLQLTISENSQLNQQNQYKKSYKLKILNSWTVSVWKINSSFSGQHFLSSLAKMKSRFWGQICSSSLQVQSNGGV